MTPTSFDGTPTGSDGICMIILSDSDNILTSSVGMSSGSGDTR